MSSSIKIESVVKEKNRMGECPVWEERENALVYVDINSQKVCRWSPVTNEVQSVSVGKSLYSLLHPGSLLCLPHPPLLVGVLRVGGLFYLPWDQPRCLPTMCC